MTGDGDGVVRRPTGKDLIDPGGVTYTGDGDGERSLIAALFTEAYIDLRTRRECNCSIIDTLGCTRCKRQIEVCDESEPCQATWTAAHTPGYKFGADLYKCRRCPETTSKARPTGPCESTRFGHTFACWHLYRTAQRFLLGRTAEWEAYRDMLCGLIDVMPETVVSAALVVLARRQRPERWRLKVAAA